MNSVITDIKNLLVAEGIGVFGANTGWSISRSTEPKLPDSTITLYNTGGDLEYTLKRSINPVQHSTFQIRVRNKVNTTSYAKALEIAQFLEKEDDFSVGDVSYYIIQRTSDIFSLGMDDNKRYSFSTNYQCTRRESE